MKQPWDEPGRISSYFEAGEQRWREHWQRGPTRRVWTELPAQAGDMAPDCELLDTEGRPVHLSSTWADQAALLLFWRHWGCGCGEGRADRLRTEYPLLTAAGARVTVIGQGEPERGDWYRHAFQIPAPILVDPDGDAYRAYGLLEMSPWLLLGTPKPPMSTFESWIPEHREMGRPVADNPFLLPGEFVVDSAGRLVLTYRYQYCDNYPDVQALLDSIREAVTSA